jgi:hypothetical protein
LNRSAGQSKSKKNKAISQNHQNTMHTLSYRPQSIGFSDFFNPIVFFTLARPAHSFVMFFADPPGYRSLHFEILLPPLRCITLRVSPFHSAPFGHKISKSTTTCTGSFF